MAYKNNCAIKISIFIFHELLGVASREERGSFRSPLGLGPFVLLLGLASVPTGESITRGGGAC